MPYYPQLQLTQSSTGGQTTIGQGSLLIEGTISSDVTLLNLTTGQVIGHVLPTDFLVNLGAVTMYKAAHVVPFSVGDRVTMIVDGIASAKSWVVGSYSWPGFSFQFLAAG